MSLISQAAKRLKSLLATTAGAAQVGFDAAVNYAAGTVGAMLKSLSASVANLQSQINGILDGATFTGPVVLPGNAAQNLEAVPLQQAMQIAADAAGLAATGVEVGRLLRVERFTTPGTANFTKQVGDRLIEAIVIGGGGGGGGSGGKGGGGAGGTAIKIFDAADIGATQSVTVGAGGTVGNSGEASIFATLTGFGGWFGMQNGGPGGGATGGDLNLTGGAGGVGISAGQLNNTAIMVHGTGGNSSLGGGAQGVWAAVDQAATGAPNTGGGGGGFGAGGSGYVEIRVYS